MDSVSIPQPQVLRSLLLAVEVGDTKKVQTLLSDCNISVETVDDDGNSILHIAAANGHSEIVRLLTIKGASLDRTNLYGWTPLMQAVRYGHESAATHLINSKANVNAANMMGLNALSLAIYGGYPKIVELLLNHDQMVVDDQDSMSNFTYPLSVATMYGRDDCLRSLLRRGAPPDQHFKYTEWTPLMLAALTGQLTMARLLVDKGANTNLKNKLNKTALEIAMDCDMKEVRGYLDRKTTVKPERVVDKGDSIITAVKKGDLERTLSFLQEDSSQANKASTDGATPLMYASINGHNGIIDLLIEYGADIDARDYENGWTALMQATYYGKTHAAIRLIHAGANVCIRAHNGVTAFDMAMLINLNDTVLFRLLAAKVMQNQSYEVTAAGDGGKPGGGTAGTPDETTQVTKAWQTTTSSGISLQNETGQSQASKTPSANPSGGGKRGLWSKMSRTMRGMKITRTLKNTLAPKKVSNFDETLIAPEEDDNNSKYNTNNGVGRTDPYAVANHGAPTAHLPTDKLSPVVPPFQTNIGVDQQTMKTQRKMSGSKSSMSNSLNSSGESSVSRNIVRPFKFLHSPNSSGRHNLSSAGGTSTVSSYSRSNSQSDTRNASPQSSVRSLGDARPISRGQKSDERYSDTAISKMSKGEIRKRNHDKSDSRRIRFSEKSGKMEGEEGGGHHRSSNASLVSSHSSSTLTPPPARNVNGLRNYHDDVRRRVTSQTKDGANRKMATQTASSPNPKVPSLNEEDEINVILRQLSLEDYHSIFEEQEIDMDAFLTLTHGDLSELGITQELPRQQILHAIDQINVGKSGSEKRATFQRQ